MGNTRTLKNKRIVKQNIHTSTTRLGPDCRFLAPRRGMILHRNHEVTNEGTWSEHVPGDVNVSPSLRWCEMNPSDSVLSNPQQDLLWHAFRAEGQACFWVRRRQERPCLHSSALTRAFVDWFWCFVALLRFLGRAARLSEWTEPCKISVHLGSALNLTFDGSCLWNED